MTSFILVGSQRVTEPVRGLWRGRGFPKTNNETSIPISSVQPVNMVKLLTFTYEAF